VKAREAKLSKEREGLEAGVARLEAQRAGLDAELAQMRRMLEEDGGQRGLTWGGWAGSRVADEGLGAAHMMPTLLLASHA